MSTLRTTLFAVGFMTIGAVGTIGAQAAASPGLGHGRHLARLIQQLDLTEDQQAQAAEIREAMQGHHEEMRAERESRRDEMLGLLGSASVDREQVHAEIDAKLAEQSTFMHDMADRFLDLHASLDDAQRATLVEQAEQAAERMEQHRSEHGERGSRGPRGDF